MNEEEKFVIKTLKDSQNVYIENTKVKKVELSTDEAKVVLNLIEKQQKELDKKDKMIGFMATAIDNYDSQLEICKFKNRGHVIEYFTNLVEKEDK